MTVPFPKSIRLQLIIIVLIVAFPALSLILYSGLLSRNEAQHDAKRDTLQLATILATELHNQVAGAEQMLTVLAQLPDLKSGDPALVVPLLRQLRTANPNYSNIFVADRHGTVWASAVPAKPFSVADRRYFQKALVSGHFTAGEYVVSRATSRPTLNFGYPLKDDQGQVIGVIGVGFSTDRYRHLLARMQPPQGTSYVLTDHGGTVLSRAIDPEKFIGKPYTPEIFRQMQTSPDGSVTIRAGISGERRIIALRKLSLPGEQEPYLYITLGIPFSEVMRDANQTLALNMTLLMAFLGAALLIAWLLGKHSIADRIGVLEQASQRLANGDLNVKVADVVAGGELGRLAQSFDSMVRQIAASDHARHDKELLLQQQNQNLAREMGERRKAQLAAEAANETKSRFLMNMSHELRTPLTGILGMMQLIKSEPLTSQQQDCLNTALKSGWSLIAILNDILDLSKIEARKIVLTHEPFPLRECISGAHTVLRAEAIRKGLKFTVMVDESLPEIVIGDTVRLRQVLTNLLGNALKFTTQGAVSLQVTPKSGGITFAVTDTGIGIPTNKQHLLFKPFSQIDDSSTRNFGGTGLGLAICQELVTLMGGIISCSSTEGFGSTFTFTIPLSIPVTSPAEIFQSQAVISDDATDTASSPNYKWPRILLAEDDATIRKLIQLALKEQPVTIETASNGGQALELWSQKHYGLIIMDVQMPVMDGIEVTKAIRERELEQGGRIPILALTAHAYKTDREWCLAAGMDDYLAKPIDLDLLNQKVMNMTLKLT
jgi:signal transduction histidine kinase/ActR/RegA family two-component response regulator